MQNQLKLPTTDLDVVEILLKDSRMARTLTRRDCRVFTPITIGIYS